MQKPESSMLRLGPVGKHAAVREGVRFGGKVTPTRPIGRDRSSLYLHVDKWERVDPVYMELSPYTHFTTETSGSSRPPTPPPGCTPDHVAKESGSPEGTREEGFVHEANLTGDDGPSLFSNKLRYHWVCFYPVNTLTKWMPKTASALIFASLVTLHFSIPNASVSP